MKKTKVTDIQFLKNYEYINGEYHNIPFNDEVEFDTHDEKELAELWWNFCFDNKLISSFKHTIEEEDYE